MVAGKAQARVPIGWLPAGLISWYAPDGRSLAMVASWMALFGGPSPRLRAGWPGQSDAHSRFWPGGDFVLNVPGAEGLPRVRDLVNRGRVCFDVALELELQASCSLQVTAPRLHDCPVQVECARGRLVSDGFEPEVVGQVVLIHRYDASFEPFAVPDLCALNPLCLEVQKDAR